jgi:hypothetical protein
VRSGRCDLKIGVARVWPGNTGGIFDILGRFWTIFGFSSIFWGPFFRFSLFLHFRRRYTRTEDATLCNCSSETRVKAGALVTSRSRKSSRRRGFSRK